MEPVTVVGMVSELVGTYEDGFEFYSKWRRKREKQNHYRKQRTGTRIYGYGAAACVDALSTSLNISGGKIKDVYDIGFSIIGQDFSRGDTICRECLMFHLTSLKNRVDLLEQALRSSTGGPLDLADILQVSEAARNSAIRAMTDLYARFAKGRPIPPDMPAPKPSSGNNGLFGGPLYLGPSRAPQQTVALHEAVMNYRQPSPQPRAQPWSEDEYLSDQPQNQHHVRAKKTLSHPHHTSRKHHQLQPQHQRDLATRRDSGFSETQQVPVSAIVGGSGPVTITLPHREREPGSGRSSRRSHNRDADGRDDSAPPDSPTDADDESPMPSRTDKHHGNKHTSRHHRVSNNALPAPAPHVSRASRELLAPPSAPDAAADAPAAPTDSGASLPPQPATTTADSPPSPPPTPPTPPKPTSTTPTMEGFPPPFPLPPPDPPSSVPDDLQSVYTCVTSISATTIGGGMLRPKNSVFSIFCPNAMQLQVDVTKKIPTGNPSGKGKDSGRCRCGYRWPVVGGMVKRSESPSGRSDPANHGSAVTSDGNRSIDPHMSNLSLASTTTSASRATNSHHTLAKDDTIVLLKEGFRLTPRFLAKSHCDASALRPGAMIDDPSAVKGGYGCVLCTSLGRAETFDDVEGLRVHINACHDKWQMLHDRDLK